MGSHHSLAERAALQHGLVTRAQAQALGATDAAIRWWCRSGWLRPVHPDVYGVGAAPDTWHQRMLGACLAAGRLAVASHRSAARM